MRYVSRAGLTSFKRGARCRWLRRRQLSSRWLFLLPSPPSAWCHLWFSISISRPPCQHWPSLHPGAGSTDELTFTAFVVPSRFIPVAYITARVGGVSASPSPASVTTLVPCRIILVFSFALCLRAASLIFIWTFAYISFQELGPLLHQCRHISWPITLSPGEMKNLEAVGWPDPLGGAHASC